VGARIKEGRKEGNAEVGKKGKTWIKRGEGTKEAKGTKEGWTDGRREGGMVVRKNKGGCKTNATFEKNKPSHSPTSISPVLGIK
jgi:hypothetical protein